MFVTPDGWPGSLDFVNKAQPILNLYRTEDTEREETPLLTVLGHPESQRAVKWRITGCSVRHPRRFTWVPGLCGSGPTDPEPLPDRKKTERRNTSAAGVGLPRKSAGGKAEENRVPFAV